MDLVREIEEKLVIKEHNSRKFPKRPDFLSIGNPIELLTNHFLLRVGQKKAFHYDIEIEKNVKPITRDTNVVDKEVEESTPINKKKNQFSRKMATHLNRKIFQKMAENEVFGGINPVYDGQKNMFTSKILNGTENRQNLRLRVELSDGRDSIFYVNIKLTETNEEIDLSILNAYHSGQTCDEEVIKKSILFINTLLRHNSTMGWIPIGQSIFNPKDFGKKLGQYLMLSYGFYSSVRNLMVGPTLNIDRSAALFYDPSVSLQKLIGFIVNADMTIVPENGLNDFQRRKIKKELLGLEVEALHIQYGSRHRKYRILGITRESAKNIIFVWNETDSQHNIVSKTKISVADYFEKKHRKKLRYPNLPCLEVGNPQNVVQLPLEVCRMVPHQRLRRLMTNDEKSSVTRASGQQSPESRLNSCRQFVIDQFRDGDIANKNKEFITEFEISVNKNLLKVNSKVIPPPPLTYGGPNSSSVTPKDGEWEMHKTRAHFLMPQSLKNWIVINMSFAPNFTNDSIFAFCKEMCAQAEEMGMSASNPLKIINLKEFIPKITFKGIKLKLDEESNSGIKMILFVTPDKAHQYSDQIYSEIKLLGDVEILRGLTTQCVNINSIWNKRNDSKKWNRSYLRNLMLKVNPKLGGTNLALLDNSSMPSIFRNKSLMIVGADVNHPAPADKISPSIAALVGSYDNEYSNYYTTVSMQPKSREEMIKYLDIMAIELLNNYQKKQNSLPQRIIFYRDGVSEGQFQHVIDNEYPLLAQAFTKVNAKYKPKLTFIVVQKRHHTRFMMADTKLNVPPGTVVERDITHKRDFDFYLCSHSGKLGTSRSAHYYVLADENGFTADDICKMTYYLCHIYQRCTKSVSIPAPVYYADLAAYRAKVHASPHLNPSDVGSIVSDNGGDELQIKTYKDMIKVSAAQKERLYFC